ncbi:MAG: hypothetical protein AB7U79_07800 [Candidatus Izemoplasmatales bacterium]
METYTMKPCEVDLFEKISTIANLQEDMVWDTQFGEILVSDKFVNEYNKFGLSGMTFVDIDKYNKPAGCCFLRSIFIFQRFT